MKLPVKAKTLLTLVVSLILGSGVCFGVDFVPLQTFDGTFPPTDWTVVDGGDTADTWFQDSGSRTDWGTEPLALVDSDAPGSGPTLEEQLITPSFDCSSATVVILEFDQYFNWISSDYADVDISTDGGVSWTTILHQVADVGTSSIPDHQELDISTYAAGQAQVQVRFYYNDAGAWAWYWAVDNVWIYEPDAVCIQASPSVSEQFGSNSSVVDHTITLLNCGTENTEFQLEVSDDDWATEITDLGGTPITSVTIDAQSSQDILVRVTVPTDQGFDEAQFHVYYAIDGQRATEAYVDLITRAAIYTEDFSTDPTSTWTGFAADQWEWGPATASTGCSGNQDPDTDHSGSSDNNLLGYNIGGCYTNSMPMTYITSPAFDFTGHYFIDFGFYRWLGVESSQFDYASVEISNDGSNWNILWEHTGGSFSDSSWTLQSFDISQYAYDQPTVYIRFGMGPSDSSVVYCGWNIDDLFFISYPVAEVNGNVSDANGVIEDATVTCVDLGVSVQTNASGDYQMYVPAGTYDFLCEATGHNAYLAEDISVSEVTPTTLDFVLTFPEIAVTPGSFDVTLNIQTSDTRLLTISNSGNGPLEFEISISDPAPPYRGPQAYTCDLGAETLNEIPDLDDPTTWNTVGATASTSYYAGDFHNNDFSMLYVIDDDTYQLRTLDTATGAATTIGACVPVSGTTWTGMACAADGTMYACSTDGTTSYLYTVDPATGTTTQVATVPHAPVLIDIAIDVDGNMYGIDIGSDVLVTIDTATGTGTTVGSIGFDASYAQDMDFDWETGILYLAAYNATSSVGELRTCNTATGETTYINQFPGGAEVDAFAIASASGGQWLSADVVSGSVPAMDSVDITLTFDANEVELPGDYYKQVNITSNDGDEPVVVVPATMHVIAPYWVTIDPEYQEGSAEADFSEDYTVTINNLGDNDDTYDLAVVSSNWTMEFPNGSSIFVAQGTSEDIIVRVTVDAGATPGDTDLGTFSVTSQGEPMMSVEGEVLTECSVPIGYLEGTITYDTSTPLEGATITVVGTGLSTTSAADGTYSFEAVPVAAGYTVRCEATGYITQEVVLDIVWHATTIQDFDMLYSEIDVSPTSFDVTMNINSTQDETLTLSNTGTGDLMYDVQIAYQTSPPPMSGRDLWDLLYDLNIHAITTDQSMLGAEFAFGSIWVTGAASDPYAAPNYLYEISADGTTLLNQYDQAASAAADWGYRDLASDGTYLYAGCSNHFYQIDPSDGSVVADVTHSLGVVIRALAYIPETDTFVTGDFSNPCIEFSFDGSTVTQIRSFNLGLAGKYGMAYDNFSAGGPFLYIFDQSGTPATSILQADISVAGSEALTGVSYVLPLLSGVADQLAGGLFFTTNWDSSKAILGGLIQGTDSGGASLDRVFGLELGDAFTWLSVNPDSGSVATMSSEDLTVTFDSHEFLAPGDFYATIIVNNNDADEDPVEVPVALHVEADYWHTVDPMYQEGAGEPTDLVDYTVTISNIGTMNDTYNLSVVSANWPIVFPGGSSVAVNAGSTADITVRVEIPVSASTGDDDLGTFAVTSTGEPTSVVEAEVFTTCTSSTGSIDGTVTYDGSTPINGALVTVVGTGLTGTTIADGTYLIEDIPVGTYTVTCEASGFNTGEELGVSVAFQSTTTVDFDLTYPDIDVSPMDIYHSMDPDSMDTLMDAVTVSNTGSGDLDYTIEVEYVDSPTLSRDLMILLVSDPSDGVSGTPENYDTVYMTAITDAGYSATLWDHDTQGSPALADLEAYDVVIWYTGISGSEAASGTTGHSCLTLAEEATLTQWMDLGGKSLCLSGMWIGWNCVADAGTSSQIASDLFDNYIGLGYPPENFNAWIIVSNSWTLQGQGDAIGGSDVFNVNWVSAENYPDQLETVTKSNASMNWYDGSASHYYSGISNDGGTFRTSMLACPLESIGDASAKSLVMQRMLSWFEEIAGGSGWLTVDPEEGTVAAMGSDGLDLMFDTTGLIDGNYLAHINIMSNDGDEPTVTVDVHLTVGDVPTPTPEPPTPTPTPTGPDVTPTPTPEPTETPACDTTGLTLEMPDTMFSPGDTCWLHAYVCNAEGTMMYDTPTVVVLAISGNYWFWPSWGEPFDWAEYDFEAGRTTIQIIPEFTWPSFSPGANGIMFYGAILNPSMTQIIGDFGDWTFGWQP